MSKPKLRVALNGVPGRMAQRVAECCARADDLLLTAALARPGSAAQGQSLAELPGYPRLALAVDTELAVDQAQVCVDFSNPTGALSCARRCAELKIPIVVCSTGLSAEQDAELQALSRSIPVLVAANTSLGVNLLAALVERVAATLDESYDIEIVESHHRFKRDAPSGTALLLARAAARGRGRATADCIVNGRDGLDAARKPGQIGVHALRMGDVVGEHRVYLTALGERLELGHVAHSRDTFAEGALRAARFLSGRGAGRYGMASVLGLGEGATEHASGPPTTEQ